MVDSKYNLYTDKLGKHWIWCDETDSNLAIRASNELEAYKQALDQAIFIISLHKEHRYKAQRDLEQIKVVFEKVFAE